MFWTGYCLLLDAGMMRCTFQEFGKIIISCHQAILSYYLQPYVTSMLKAHIRIGLAIICTICFFVVAVTGMDAFILQNI
jgi:hypothetical protein